MTKDNSKELSEWRASHFDELEKTLKILISIRDSEALVPVKCPKCKAMIELAITSAKDKIEASKGIGRLLSAMAPEKVSSASSEEKDSAAVTIRNIPTLPPALRKQLKAITNAKRCRPSVLRIPA